MQENKYDEPKFFEEYGKMYRSQKSLSAAGEWIRVTNSHKCLYL
ncbi:hypothetical protein SPPR111872_03865 [Sphingobacterium prati]